MECLPDNCDRLFKAVKGGIDVPTEHTANKVNKAIRVINGKSHYRVTVALS